MRLIYIMLKVHLVHEAFFLAKNRNLKDSVVLLVIYAQLLAMCSLRMPSARGWTDHFASQLLRDHEFI